ncbi:hypothetical protein V6N13_097148 [Hibiscus sabdariffa]
MHLHRTLIIIYWAAWGARNKNLHENSTQTIQGLINSVRVYLHEIDGLTSSISTPLAEVRNDRWSPPGHNVFKVNFDASFNSLQHSSVSGIIIRDENGMTMAASSYPHHFVADPESAEALSCLQALVFAEELGFRRIVVEGDSLLVVSKLSNSRMDFSSVSHILFSIKERARDFDLISFVHINRARNQVAPSLASLGRNFSSPQVWIE